MTCAAVGLRLAVVEVVEAGAPVDGGAGAARRAPLAVDAAPLPADDLAVAGLAVDPCARMARRRSALALSFAGFAGTMETTPGRTRWKDGMRGVCYPGEEETVRAAPLVRVKVKFTVIIAVCNGLGHSYTGVLARDFDFDSVELLRMDGEKPVESDDSRRPPQSQKCEGENDKEAIYKCMYTRTHTHTNSHTD